tara:strand:- start:3440 stop:3949 length:510 start_codon:yes stop_codon:yes gene_type:complete
MASILKVDTVQGATTATTVAMPSNTHIPGHVVQTVEYKAMPTYIEVSSNTFTASNMQVDITPKYNNSKIILRASWSYWLAADSNNYQISTIYRNGSNLGTGSYSGIAFHGPMRNSTYNNHTMIETVDYPATTNSTNYRVYCRPYNANVSNLRFQWSATVSFLQAMEIAV